VWRGCTSIVKRSSLIRRSVENSLLTLAALALLCSALGCSDKHRGSPNATEEIRKRTFEGATGAQISPAATRPEDGQWSWAAKDFANSRFSSLDQINTQTVKNLKVAWTFKTGVLRGNEAAPIVVNDTMYLITPFPNILYALDLRKNGAKKWSYEPKPDAAAQGVACCDVVNRGGSYADGKIIYGTLDNHAVAVDANTGTEVWKAKLGEINRGETMTMAPLVVRDKAFFGNSGGEFGVRGWMTAINIKTGKIAWRAYNTGPDSEVLVGARFKPYYSQYRDKDLGVKSWPPEQWKIGGGTAWGWTSYDPESNLIFYGTGNPGPWHPEQRPGDNHFTSGIFARDADTGEAVWYYQWSPHDLFDYDGVNENLLLDLPINGQMRKTIVRPERNGYMYVLDRTSGQVLSATPFAHITSTRGVDLKSGRLDYAEDKEPRTGIVTRDICPAAPGAKDWQPSAFSPRTGLVYIPHNNLCMDHEGFEANYIAGTPYLGSNVKMYAGPGGHRGLFTAWDPVHNTAVWQLKEHFPAWSGALVTAGDVVFYGTMDGWFKAVDARSGQELWKFKAESGIIGQPITYRGPDGKQYVAVYSGVGGWSGVVVSNQLDPTRDAGVALGFGNAMQDLSQYTKPGDTLYVFALP